MQRLFSRTVLGVLSVSTALAGDLNPPGGNVGPTMKTLAQVEPRISIGDETTPGDADSLYRISVRGSYYLTSNFTGVSGKSGIEIAASHVTLDLAGFTLTGASNAPDGIVIGADLQNITIINGTVRAWPGDGIDGLGASGMQIVDVRAIDNRGVGLRAGPASRLSNCTVLGNDQGGILAGVGSLVSHCNARSNGNVGISAITGSTVIGCNVALTNGIGITVSHGSLVADCTSSDNLGVGIDALFHCRVRDCSAYNNNTDGINGRDHTLISGCNTYSNVNGIEVADDCVVRDCTCAGEAGSAILAMGHRNRIEGNHIGPGGSAGIAIFNTSTKNLVIRNSVSFSIGAYSIPAGNIVGPIVTGATIAASTNPHANYSGQ